MAKISVYDDMSFKTHHEILNTYFVKYLGKLYKAYQKGWLHITGPYYIWFPTIACKENGVWIPGNVNSTYVNVLQNNGEEILEYSQDEEPLVDGTDNTIRIVFAKEKSGDAYSFIGLYKSAYANEMGYNYLRRIHKRIATEIDTDLLDQKFLDKEIIQKAEETLKIPNLSTTEKDAVIKIRVGQGLYRDNLLNKHKCRCMLCNLGMKDLLIASHIKEWSESQSDEKLDPENGLLLCALHDALFDRHFITFNSDGEILISERLSHQDRLLCNINSNMKIQMSDKMREYMDYHRKKFYDLNK